jgi:hypothetical protein
LVLELESGLVLELESVLKLEARQLHLVTPLVFVQGEGWVGGDPELELSLGLEDPEEDPQTQRQDTLKVQEA